MNDYPHGVASVVEDYLTRLREQLEGLPVRDEREEFVQEVQSHLYEAYQRETGDDDIKKILAVVRNLGDPAEVVADRLPQSMDHRGSARKLPLRILGVGAGVTALLLLILAVFPTLWFALF